MRPDALLGCLVGLCGFRPVNSLLCASPLSVRCRLSRVQQAWPVPDRRHPSVSCTPSPGPPPPQHVSSQSLALLGPLSRERCGPVPLLSDEQTADGRGQGSVQQKAGRRFGPGCLCFPWAVTPPAARLGHRGTPSAWLSGAPRLSEACPWTRVVPAHRFLPPPTRGLDEPLDGAPRALKPHSPASSPGGPQGRHPAPRLQPCRLGLPETRADARDPAGRHGELLPRGDASPAPVFAAGGPSAPAERQSEPASHAWAEPARLCWEPACALLAGLLLIRRTSGRRVCSDSLSWAARISRSSRPLLRRHVPGRRAGGGPSPDHTLSSASPCWGASWDAKTRPWGSLW